ncbi:hypothetical protein Tco_0833257 [Tanacetum coccineum]
MCYYFYYPLVNKILVSRNVEFFENSFMVAPTEVEPYNVRIPIRRSGKIPQVPDRYGYYVDIEEYELEDLNEPPNYKAALAYPESDKWLKATNTKMQSMKDNQVWYLVDLSSNGRTVRCKCLFKKKTDMDGNTILGIKIIRDRSKRLIALSHSAYLEKILKKIRMENSKNWYTPMMEKPDYRKLQGAKTPTEDDTKSQTGYVFVLNGGAVDCKSAKQSTTVMSSTEAEYIVAAEASMEVVWMRKFIDGLGDVMPSNKRPMEMLCDNERALAIANDPRLLKGAKHFQRKYHYIREVIQKGEIVLKKVHTDENVVDPFTKPMPLNKHFEHAMAIRIVPASSLM